MNKSAKCSSSRKGRRDLDNHVTTPRVAGDGITTIKENVDGLASKGVGKPNEGGTTQLVTERHEIAASGCDDWIIRTSQTSDKSASGG